MAETKTCACEGGKADTRGGTCAAALPRWPHFSHRELGSALSPFDFAAKFCNERAHESSAVQHQPPDSASRGRRQ
eukprot:scaffold53014_cov36-Phaeocystis_antarctica.AAC.1